MTDLSTEVNHQLRLARRPTGLVTPDDFEPATGPLPELADGEALMRTIYLGMDATVRTWLNRGEGYLPAVAIGEVVRCSGIGRVVATRCPAYEVGDVAYSLPGWQDYAVIRDDLFTTKIEDVTDLRSMMSVFGATGAAAYFGLLDVGRIQAGETVVVSAAAGATGSIAGQIAKIHGCRAIGIAGGAEKCRWLVEECGFDAAIDYKNEPVGKRLKELCPKGVDVFFDNVGGEVLDAALARLALRGRVVLCGGVARYNDATPSPGPKNYLNLVVQRGRMEGFLIFDYMPRAAEAVAALSGWLKEGRLKNRVDVQEGLENAPLALTRLFKGENRGKQLVRIAEG